MEKIKQINKKLEKLGYKEESYLKKSFVVLEEKIMIILQNTDDIKLSNYYNSFPGDLKKLIESIYKDSQDIKDLITDLYSTL